MPHSVVAPSGLAKIKHLENLFTCKRHQAWQRYTLNVLCHALHRYEVTQEIGNESFKMKSEAESRDLPPLR